MRIQRLEVEGFRSLKKVSWEPGTLNVVIGPNGSGKSNLLKYINFFASSLSGQSESYILRSGGFTSLAWNNEIKPINVSLSFSSQSYALDENFKPTNNQITYFFNISYSLETSPFNRIGYSNEHTELYYMSDDHRIDIFDIKHTGNELVYSDSNNNITKSAPFSSSINIFNTPNRTFTDNIENNLQHFKQYASLMSTYYTLDTSEHSPLRLPVVTAYEQRVKPDASNLIQVLHTLYTSDRNFESDIDSAMNAAFGNDYEKLVFPPAADQRVQLRIRWKSLKREQSALDISDGTLRFLYLLAILANPDPSPLIAIDEPETGLHPSMFPIIAEFAQDCSRKSQIIFTTHSPQFLDAFGDTPPTTTVAQWQNGETILKVLDGERLTKWLKHYSMGSMFMSGELEAFD